MHLSLLVCHCMLFPWLEMKSILPKAIVLNQTKRDVMPSNTRTTAVTLLMRPPLAVGEEEGAEDGEVEDVKEGAEDGEVEDAEEGAKDWET